MQGFTLTPATTYYPIWIPSDPSDISTYYPQAVFRLASTFAVIGTVNLDKQSDGSYKGSFAVPQDPSNMGMYIVETLTVYTDVAQTVISSVYALEQIKHKIQNVNQNYGGGGGDNVDYNYIDKVVTRIISEAVGGIKFEQKDVDLSSIGALENRIKKLHSRVKKHEAYFDEHKNILDKLSKKEIVFPKGEYESHFGWLSYVLDGLKVAIEKLRIDVTKLNDDISADYSTFEPMVKKHLDGQHIADHDAFNKSHKEIKEKMDKHIKEIIDNLEHRFEGVDYLAYRRGYEPKKDKKNNIDEIAKQLIS